MYRLLELECLYPDPGVSKSQESHYFISSFVQWRCINFNLSIQTKSPTSNITGWKAHVRDPNFIFHTELWLHYILYLCDRVPNCGAARHFSFCSHSGCTGRGDGAVGHQGGESRDVSLVTKEMNICCLLLFVSLLISFSRVYFYCILVDLKSGIVIVMTKCHGNHRLIINSRPERWLDI